jgi:hypothetical protein
VWSVALQREARLSVVRKRHHRDLSTLWACRQSSTALRLLLVNDAEDEEVLRKQLTRRSSLITRSLKLQEWYHNGHVQKFRCRSADLFQTTKLLT